MQLPMFLSSSRWRARSALAFVPRVDMVREPVEARPAGISVVIPSRNGFELLRDCLPRISDASEIIVVDNGSDDGTAEKLHVNFPDVIVVHSSEPLSFARAVNRGIGRARFSHVCLLNNDMLVEPGFLDALRAAFDQVPNLFAASAQIFFPEGQRREETGKTVMPATHGITELPLRCDEPLANEDLSYVLYGSGGCTLYDARKLAALGGFDEIYDPAYVEDLDRLGVRAWQQNWPSVYCADAQVLHFHRATTSKYFTPRELDRALEYNYLRFLGRAIGDRARFEKDVAREYRAVEFVEGSGRLEVCIAAADAICRSRAHRVFRSV